MDTLWNEFASSGKIEAYLKYREGTDSRPTGTGDKQEVDKNGF